VKLTLDRIVDAGMAVFAEQGFAGLTMRQVADRLGVHAGSLYYHVRAKDQLLALLADRVAGEAYAAGTAALERLTERADWRRRVEAQLTELRRTLRDRPGAPLLLALSPALLAPGALSLAEGLLETLRDAGVPPATRSAAVDTMLSYVTGFVLQEQSESMPPPDVDGTAMASLAARFPLVMAAGPAQDPDHTFRSGVGMLCAGIATLIR
jgi:TetR/AcrR family tetracycline transcriptional repressor